MIQQSSLLQVGYELQIEHYLTRDELMLLTSFVDQTFVEYDLEYIQLKEY